MWIYVVGFSPRFKKNQRKIESDGENEEGVEELKVSKKKLSKITKDGPFSGKNKIFFNA